MKLSASLINHLRRVLPQSGPYFPYSKGVQPKVSLQTIKETAKWCLGRETDVYISLSSFTDKRGHAFRAARSFWADVDVGDKTYSTQLSAIAALDLAIARGLPAPLILSSGTGLHLVWTLLEEMDEPTWRKRAKTLKACLENAGLNIDSQRTTDPSNGPRVPETINSKFGDVVRVVRPTACAWTGRAWDYAVRAEKSEGPGRLGASQPGIFERSIAEKTHLEISNSYENLEFSGELIAEHCLQMRALREGSHTSEPTWVSLLGVLAHCKDGDGLAHSWSARDLRYDYHQTQGKLDYARERGYKPTTCGKLRSVHPVGCEGCPFAGKFASPIALGRIEREVPSVSIEADHPQGIFGSGEELPPPLPEGYSLRGKFIIKEKDDGSGWFKVCQAAYCVGRSQEGLEQSYTWLVRNGSDSRWESFSLSGADSTAKSRAFSDRVLIMNDVAADAYIRTAKGAVLQSQHAEETRKSFGWVDSNEGFLLGNVLYKADGGQSVIRALSSPLAALATAFITSGEEKTWRTAMMRVAGASPVSAFLIMLSAGAPLHRVVTDEGGTVLVLRSHGSGIGKTTSLAAAMSIWGRWKSVANWSNDTKLSVSGKWELIGNLPMPWDEAGMKDDEELRNRVMVFSEGAPRLRTGRDGVLKAAGSRWSTFLLCTTNNDFRRRLGVMAGATEGPTARLLQLELGPNHKPTADGGALLSTFSKHYGFAGPRLISAYIEKLTEFEEKLITLDQARMRRLGLTNSARFLSRAITCAEVGGQILKHAQVLPELDVASAIEAAEAQVLRLVLAEAELSRSADLVAQFIRQKTGELILVGPNMEQAPLRVIAGRFEQDQSIARLFVPAASWARWCATYNKSDAEVERDAAALGHRMSRETIDLARGTRYPAQPRTRCVVVELDVAAAKAVSSRLAESKVVPLRRGH